MLKHFLAWFAKQYGKTTTDQDNTTRPSLIPKIIWFAWLQGIDQAPEIVSACFATWKKHNPNWLIHFITTENLHIFLDEDDVFAVTHGKNLEPETFCDVLRIALLQRYGGVWVDGTTYCLQPLDAWLHENTAATGFFVFEKPTADRMIASWFIAASKNNYLIQQWHDHIQRYWLNHTQRDEYFWLHRLFKDIYETDAHFKKVWDATPKISAKRNHYYSRLPNHQMLYQAVSHKDEEMLISPPFQMLKLTHKLKEGKYSNGSVLQYLCDKAYRPMPAKPQNRHLNVLVAWYGSIDGHGTIGDLLAMQSVSSHLVGKGHHVSHASATDFYVYGAQRVQLPTVSPEKFDAMIFVCGPIIKGQKSTALLFDKFKDCYKLGVGVSLFPRNHKNHINPFDDVLAREGQPQQFEDVAVLAPRTMPHSQKQPPTREITIGIVLRGNQAEYGVERCLWKETEKIAFQAVETLLAEYDGQVIKIENHLRNAGLTAHEIEAQYEKCDLVITSRFHGAMLAARHSVPFIAIDQIQGGAKISALLGQTGWPHVFQIENTNTEQIIKSAHQLLQTGFDETFCNQRDKIMLRANLTLTQMDRYLENRP